MGNLFTEEVGKVLTRLLGNYLTEALGKVLDIYKNRLMQAKDMLASSLILRKWGEPLWLNKLG